MYHVALQLSTNVFYGKREVLIDKALGLIGGIAPKTDPSLLNLTLTVTPISIVEIGIITDFLINFAAIATPGETELKIVEIESLGAFTSVVAITFEVEGRITSYALRGTSCVHCQLDTTGDVGAD